MYMRVGRGRSEFSGKVVCGDEGGGYSYEKMIGREGWNGKEYMERGGSSMGRLDGSSLSWNGIEGGGGYVIFVNGVYLGESSESWVCVRSGGEGV